MKLDKKLWFEAVTTVINKRIEVDGHGRNLEHYTVGSSDSETVSLSIKTIDGVTRIAHCTCKFHSNKDVQKLGLCSASLAVLFYKMRNIEKRLQKELQPL